ncbi:leucine-rich repeat protein (LRRP), protein [Trypanosoma vivax Y486]|uniref:Leucine-rich repeat protein (LRRP), protein n=1 Tax=Trypanosoma vivax (strain Y486) TaxID=1055687 RepID=F9WS59_TRYVY|nr:leucine-rich repeat protein (LRRP), protein [Trypanosoma vivax Y486]|eukprot:CCD20397.1 leucine-rich repeat protein (LRRP), protein [Trypanosoma vivax Y486]
MRYDTSDEEMESGEESDESEEPVDSFSREIKAEDASRAPVGDDVSHNLVEGPEEVITHMTVGEGCAFLQLSAVPKQQLCNVVSLTLNKVTLDKDFSLLQNCKRLSKLFLDECWGEKGVPIFLQDLTSLRKLLLHVRSDIRVLSNSNLPRSIEELSLRFMDDLEEITLRYFRALRTVTGLGLLKKLRAVDFSHTAVDNACLRELRMASGLSELRLEGCPCITDLSSLSGSSVLKTLVLGGDKNSVGGVCGVTQMYSSLDSVDVRYSRDAERFTRRISDRYGECSSYRCGCKNICDITPLGSIGGLEALDLCDCTNIAHGWQRLSQLNYLRELRVGGAGIDNMFIQMLGTHGRLRVLVLEYCNNITDISPLGYIRGLEVLGICECMSVKGGWSCLARLRMLKQFHLRDSRTGNIALKSITACQQLQALVLHRCSNITDISPLSDLQSLVSLDIRECMNIVEGWNCFMGLRMLKMLHLLEARISNDSLRSLAACTQLQVLVLHRCNNITDTSLLGSFQYLQVLDVRECSGISQGCAYLNNLPYLRAMQLRGLVMDGSFVHRLTNQRHIRVLMLQPCVFIDDISPLQHLRELEVLSLCNCERIERGWDALAGLEKLKDLYILKGRFGNSFLRALQRNTHLRSLALYSCPGISDISSLGDVRGLEMLDIDNCASIRDGWYGLAKLKGLKELYLRQVKLPRSFASVLRSCESLRVLEIFACKPVFSVSPLGTINGLEVLVIDNCNASATELNGLLQLKCLVALHLSKAVLSRRVLRGLRSCVHLQSVCFDRCKVEKGAVFRSHHGLSVVDFTSPSKKKVNAHYLFSEEKPSEFRLQMMKLSRDFLNALKLNTHLRTLVLYRCTFTNVSPLGDIKTLEVLDLDGCSRIKKGLDKLHTLVGLKTLRLTSRSVRNSFLKGLAKLKHLRSLSLTRCGITDVSGLGCIHWLEALDLSYCTKINKGSRCIGEIKSLKELTLRGCRIYYPLFYALDGSDTLRKLSLKYCEGLTDVYPLGAIHMLEDLDIRYCNGIEKGWHGLLRLKRLKELWVNGVKTDDAILGKLQANGNVIIHTGASFEQRGGKHKHRGRQNAGKNEGRREKKMSRKERKKQKKREQKRREKLERRKQKRAEKKKQMESQTQQAIRGSG